MNDNTVSQIQEKPQFSLSNQRLALEYLNDFLKQSPSDGAITTQALKDVLLGSSIYVLTPKGSTESLNLLIFLSSRLEKVIDEIAQLYMLGPAESLLEYTWLESQQKILAENRRERLYFIYHIIMDFYAIIAKRNPGLPLPYDVQPIPSIDT